MRWPWQKRKETAAAHARADAAMEVSREQRADACRKAQEARQRAARWRRWHAENHFVVRFRALEDK